MSEGSIISVVFVVVVCVLIKFYSKAKNKKEESNPLSAKVKKDNSTKEQKLNRVNTEQVFPLSIGDKGERVRQYQIYLAKKGALFTKINGVWDSETESNSIKFLGKTKIGKDFFIKEKIYLL